MKCRIGSQCGIFYLLAADVDAVGEVVWWVAIGEEDVVVIHPVAKEGPAIEFCEALEVGPVVRSEER